MGTSRYSYNPTGHMPRLGANRLARFDGPLPNAAVTYDYDELGTVKSVGVNGDSRTIERDLAGRLTSETNAGGVREHVRWRVEPPAAQPPCRSVRARLRPAPHHERGDAATG
jgi:hypothetical protein